MDECEVEKLQVSGGEVSCDICECVCVNVCM